MEADTHDGELVYDPIEEEPEYAEPEYTVKLEGPGLMLERKLPQDLARAIMHLVMGGTPDVAFSAGAPARTSERPAVTRGHPGPTGHNGPPRSLREYMDDCGAKRHPEKILVIAQYLSDEHGQSIFSREDVKGQFRFAGEPVPGNYSRDFTTAVSTGWIAADRATGEFYVTGKGRQAIEQKFSADVRRVNRPVRRRRGQRKASTEGDTTNGE